VRAEMLSKSSSGVLLGDQTSSALKCSGIIPGSKINIPQERC
jgi:hypothetical protein